MNPVRTIAWRVMRELARDRRTMAFFFLVPLAVMSLVYVVLAKDEIVKIAVESRGAARFFSYDIEMLLEDDEDVELVTLGIPDNISDKKELEPYFVNAIASGTADGILFFDKHTIEDRFAGERGILYLYLEGTRPTLSASVGSAIADVSDDLVEKLPTVIDASCSSECAASVNTKALDIQKVYLHASEDYKLSDFFLPVLIPFFAFFLTFVLSVISFQRERNMGTLERLLVAPVSFGSVVGGYLAGFAPFALGQVLIVLAFSFPIMDMPIAFWQVAETLAVSMVMAVMALLMGLTASFAAKNEFQAIQFIPLIILPQVFLGGIIWHEDKIPFPFDWLSRLMPITHSGQLMRDILLRGEHFWHHSTAMPALLAMIAVIALLLARVGRNYTKSV